MARQKGSANFAGTLEVLAGGPLDARSQVPTKADLTVASNFPYPYVGMETFVLSEKKKYRLIGQDPTDIDNWEVEGSGSSVDTSKLYSTDDTVSTDLADDDYIPFYDTSTSGKKKSLWSNIKAKLKTYFDTLYPSIGGHTIEDPEGTALTQRDTLQFGGDLEVSDDDENKKTVVVSHELTAAELTEIMSTLPGQPTQGITIDLRGNEQVVGKVIESDGTEKTLYQKTVDCGALPNNSSKFVEHHISNIDKIVCIFAVGVKSSGTFPIPYSNTDAITNQVQFEAVTSSDIRFYTRINYSDTNAYVTLQYTKTT